MIYFDAAYIAKCYLNEPGAERVRAAASEHGYREIYTNDRHMLASARYFGLAGIDVLGRPR